MKILIVSYYFAPANIIGAVRFSKLSKYFKLQGHEVDVFCSEENRWLFIDGAVRNDPILENDTSGLSVNRVQHSKFYKFIAQKLSGITSKFFNKKSSSLAVNSETRPNVIKFTLSSIKYNISKFSMLCLSLFQDFDFVFKALTNKDFRHAVASSDIVISTYGPYAGHILALFIKMYNRKIKWIADFRDPISQPSDPISIRFIHKIIQHLSVKFSNHIVCVSQGYADSIVSKKYKNKTTVITNGFDTDDICSLDSSFHVNKNRFIFSYTGTFYSGRRDISIILQALSELCRDKTISKQDFEFHYAGPEENYAKSLFSSYELGETLVSHGMVGRDIALTLNSLSDVLIVATWDEPGHRGVLPGKLYELMLFKKPILSIVQTDTGDCEISRMIIENKLGFAYESNKNKSYSDLKIFLKKVIESKSKGSRFFETQSPESFSYFNLSLKYSEIFRIL